MSDQSKDASTSHTDPTVNDGEDEKAKREFTASGAPESALKTSYYLLLLYAALFGALFSLLAAGYISLYNWGVTFFQQPSSSFKIGGISFWPLMLLTITGVLLGLAIKFFGQHAGLGGPGAVREDVTHHPPLCAEHFAGGLYHAVEWRCCWP